MEYWGNAYDNRNSYFTSTNSAGELQPLSESTSNSRTPRLPPRSRSGCWTCRSRKVKCDERRPKCKQCMRLDHECDYSPKLVFKDETLKVVDKYVEPPMSERSWTSESEQQLFPIEPDSLPPFTHLNTDEDWQQKATYQPPGTYYVVANSDSFAESPEYRASITADTRSQPSAQLGQRAKSNVSLDHATVILGHFEGGSRRSFTDSPGTTNERRSSLSLHIPHTSYSFLGSPITSPATSVATMPPNEYSENTLIHHWRSFVRQQLFGTNIPSATSTGLMDLIEGASTTYLPLRHALLALCALSLAMKQEGQTVQALEHYTKAIEALKESHAQQDLASDGLFLTHYILLIYEISATEKCWYHHMESLKPIIARRQMVMVHEPFASIVFSIYTIDTTALISCSGHGTMVLDQTFREYIPTFQDRREAACLLPTDRVTKLEWDALGPTYNFLHDLINIWTRLGQISYQIRQELQERRQPKVQDQSGGMNLYAVVVTRWHARISHAREALKQLWHIQGSSLLSSIVDEQAPVFGRIRQTYEQAILSYHSGLVYSYTNMWPTQAGDLDAGGNDFSEVQQSITEILGIATAIVARGDMQQRSAVLALLLAGNASRNDEERYSALELLKSFEDTGLGSNTRATRTLLKAILRRKRELKAGGHTEHVDWILMAQELGWQHLVNFGL